MDEGEDDENRRIILARRARFVMAAISGLSLAVSCSETEPHPCLDAPPPGEGGASNTFPGEAGGGFGGFGGNDGSGGSNAP